MPLPAHAREPSPTGRGSTRASRSPLRSPAGASPGAGQSGASSQDLHSPFAKHERYTLATIMSTLNVAWMYASVNISSCMHSLASTATINASTKSLPNRMARLRNQLVGPEFDAALEACSWACSSMKRRSESGTESDITVAGGDAPSSLPVLLPNQDLTMHKQTHRQTDTRCSRMVFPLVRERASVRHLWHSLYDMGTKVGILFGLLPFPLILCRRLVCAHGSFHGRSAPSPKGWHRSLNFAILAQHGT